MFVLSDVLAGVLTRLGWDNPRTDGDWIRFRGEKVSFRKLDKIDQICLVGGKHCSSVKIRHPVDTSEILQY